jgi:CHAD domain-containing protein
VNEPDADRPVEGAVRVRAFELSQGPGAGTAVENWLRAERELGVAHGYDTVDRDLERLGMTILRLPMEAGVVWRLALPRGERVEEWEPGNAGLTPPARIERLIAHVVAGKELVPAPPLSDDPGARRLRDLLEEQRRALLVHDPGTRLGNDPENLHQHRVAARRVRAFMRATRAFVDPDWRRALNEPLRELGVVTGPVRDLDVLIEHVGDALGRVGESDRNGGAALLARLECRRDEARRRLLQALDGDDYRTLLARLRFPPRLPDGTGTIPLDQIARREFRGLAKTVDRLGKRPNDAALHGVRIALKRARYAAELSSPGRPASKKFLAHAKALQMLLGEHHDAVVAEEQLRSAVVDNAQTAAAFVAGRLAERQVARRARVLEQLPAAWKRLRRSGAQLG